MFLKPLPPLKPMYLSLLRLIGLIFFSISTVCAQVITDPSFIQLSKEEQDWIKNHPVLIVGGGSDWAPFNFVNSEGKHVGLAHDYLTLVANKTGLNFEIQIDQWSHHLKKLKNREIDLLPAAFYTEARSQYVTFSKPYFSALDYFFVRDDLQVDSLDDLNGKRVAVPKKYAYIDILKNNFPKIKIVSVNTFSDAIDAVLENDADMLYDTYAAMAFVLKRESINSIIPFKSTRTLGDNPIHMIVPKDETILASIVQKGLNAISQQEKQTIYNRWLGAIEKLPVSPVNLTAEEHKWLEAHPLITLGAESNWPPYEFISQTGEFSGFTADIIHLLERRLPVRFEIISEYNWTKTLEKVKNSSIDMIGGIVKTPEREQFLNFTTHFFTSSNSIFTRKGSKEINKISDLNNQTVAVEEQFYLQNWLETRYPKIILKPVETTKDALQAVSFGQADAYIGDQSVAHWQIEKYAITNLKVAPAVDENLKELPIRLAVRKDWQLFRDILNKTLATVSAAELSSLRHKWFGVGVTSKVVELTVSEQQWLDRHKTIRFSGDPNWLPYEGTDEQGEYIGIVSEYLKLIEEKLGIELEIIATESWGESVENIKNEKIDVLSIPTDSNLSLPLTYTQQYLSSPIVIIMEEKADYVETIKEIKKKKIALVKNHGSIQAIMAKYPDIDFEVVDTVYEGLTDVSTGKIDVLFATLAHASYLISEHGINDVRIVGKTEFNTTMTFAMRAEFSPLVELFNRAISNISQAEKQTIFNDWGKDKFTQRPDYRWLAAIVGVLLFFVIFILYWNRKLSKEIAKRIEAESQVQTVINSIPLQIIVTTINGKILSANPKALIDYAINEENLQEYNVLNFYANKNDRRDIIKTLAASGRVENTIISFLRPDGSSRSMLLSILPIKYMNQLAFLTIAVDMTERIEIEAAMQQAKDDAESANRAKSEFLANMSHEIRTPMNAIIGFAEILNDQISDSTHKGFVNTIQSAGNSLLTIINDILDLSKIEAGKLTINRISCNPYVLFTKLVDIFIIKISEKDIDFILDVDPEIPENLMLDEVRLRQVLFNLIGNALKFTEKGHIKLRAYTENYNKLNNTISLIMEVEDTGLGIPEKQQDLIFQAFEQSEHQDIKKYGGTGLGLSISQRLMNMMGGDISVTSELGTGSIFRIRLNDVNISYDSMQTDVDFQDKAEIKFKPCHVLIVDDIESNRQLLFANFANTNITTTEAKNGLQAVELAKKHEFDLILMDIRMPVMDGYQAAKQIKTFSDTPIVALTASVMTDDFEQVKSFDFQGYLRKPVLKKRLFSELCRFLPHAEKLDSNHQKQAVTLEKSEIKNLPELIMQLKLLIPQCEAIMTHNKISEIQAFSNSVSELENQNPLSIVANYVSVLNSSIESFDITGIKKALQGYFKLINTLEKLNRQG